MSVQNNAANNTNKLGIAMKNIFRLPVHPCFIGNKNTLIFEKGLIKINRYCYKLLQKYAVQNSFHILEDRRANFIEGVKRVIDPLRRNIIPLLLLLRLLVNQKTFAEELVNDT